MTNAKNTKRALVSSLLALVLCMSMLIGSTYAWFTDTATTNVNTIQSGKLDVTLVGEDGATNLEGQTLQFKKAAGHENEAILWEPGCTYELTPFKVKNNGNLALKYKVVLSGVDGDAKLLEAITWSVKIGGTTTDIATFEESLNAGAVSEKSIVLVGHMKEEAGNEYQDLTASGVSIIIYATQATVEYDSYNNTYDAGAQYSDAPLTPAVPTAVVTVDNDNVTVTTYDNQQVEMDVIYTFKANDTAETVLTNEYKDWLCDFYISFDKDVAEGAGAIAGSYAGWQNGGWYVLEVPSGGISAGREIALLQTLKNEGVNDKTTWDYEDICTIVNEFKCGVVAEHEESANGTVMTVELRLTNPEDATDVKVINSIQYTFN